jgi:hypothetical protein
MPGRGTQRAGTHRIVIVRAGGRSSNHEQCGIAIGVRGYWMPRFRGSRIASGDRSRDAPLRPSVAKACHVKREGRGRTRKEWGGASVSLFATPVSPKPRNRARNKERNKGSGTPADADQHPPHLAMRRAPCKTRSPFGVPPRLSPKGIIPSQRLSFRPGFLGRGLNGRYPPSPVPVQGCTSRPGHSAGRLMPKPPGNGVYGPVRGHRPRSAAGEYPRPTASLLSEIDSLACNWIGDGCQELCHYVYDVHVQQIRAFIRSPRRRGRAG